MPVIVLLFSIVFSSVISASVVAPNDWKKVGEAELKVLWFRIYEAELLTPNGGFKTTAGPLMLRLNYKRDIAKEDLLEETKDQLKPFASDENIDAWSLRLKKIWPEIKEGDQLSFLIDEAGQGHFFYNQSWIGSIPEMVFSHAFISIWLSDNSSYPSLAKKLRGEFNDETLR